MKNDPFIISGRVSEKELLQLKEFTISAKNKSVTAEMINEDLTPCRDFSVRNSKVHFADPKENIKVSKILQSHLLFEYFDAAPFLDYSLKSEIQYAVYEKGNYFKRHRDDVHDDSNYVRCLTMSINISDEKNYKAGELEVYSPIDNNTYTLDKRAGSYIIFPSVYEHAALEITEGVREAIVCWIYDEITAGVMLNKKIENATNNKLS